MYTNSTALERGKRLEMIISMTGLKIIDFANESEIGVSTLRNWINGRASGLSEKGARKVINFVMQKGINCSLSWLMHGEGPLPRFDQTIRSQVRDNDAYIFAEHGYKKLSEEFKFFLDNHPSSITTILEDDSMEPFYKIGENLGGILLEEDKFHEALGKDCIVVTEQDGVLVRRVIKGEENGLYTLFCLNPETSVYPPVVLDAKLKGIAPIIRVWRRL